jgi:hypothetical protein
MMNGDSGGNLSSLHGELYRIFCVETSVLLMVQRRYQPDICGVKFHRVTGTQIV